jgi:hypothetical protein
VSTIIYPPSFCIKRLQTGDRTPSQVPWLYSAESGAIHTGHRYQQAHPLRPHPVQPLRSFPSCSPLANCSTRWGREAAEERSEQWSAESSMTQRGGGRHRHGCVNGCSDATMDSAVYNGFFGPTDSNMRRPDTWVPPPLFSQPLSIAANGAHLVTWCGIQRRCIIISSSGERTLPCTSRACWPRCCGGPAPACSPPGTPPGTRRHPTPAPIAPGAALALAIADLPRVTS